MKKIELDFNKFQELVRNAEINDVNRKLDKVVQGLLIVLAFLNVVSLFFVRNTLSYFIYFILFNFIILNVILIYKIKVKQEEQK
jgi:hypothetical protein